ncbi:hypothetical protein GCM10027275_12780 [Rhabdobacter roseus]|uniref:CHRD domain-containing protein n=1 Tax=Rhabdobacter roseus TaxID=1655419 RepID=A0A840TIA0_9BACT|nr:CHRD domain-containing protein [Rhabdobacter roseus]MBB5283194.1 hypothetical protein [Rhabdobacter roseus]
MKRILIRYSLLLLGVAMLGFVSACKDEGPHNDEIVRFRSTINSQYTIPRTTSSAQGAAVLEYNKSNRVLTYNISYQGITPTAARIHSAEPAWETGPVEFTFTNYASSPITGSVTLNQRQENALMFGRMYINIYSAANIYGEIRGQIVLDAEN